MMEEVRKAEEEALKMAEDARKAEEEAKKQAEEEAKKRADEEAKRKAEEVAKKMAEEAEAKKKIEEAKKKAAEEAAKKAEEEARKKAEEEAKKKAAEEAAKKAAEEAKLKELEDAKAAALEAAKIKAAEEERLKAAEEARKRAEEARKKAEEAMKVLENAKKMEEEAKRKAEEAENIKLDLTKMSDNGKLPLAAYYLEKYLEVPKASDQIVNSFSAVSKNPEKSRNIVILGQHGFGSTTVGDDFARSFYDMGICSAKTIAKIKAQALNKLTSAKLNDAMAKLKGGCIVIENAGLIVPEKLEELVKLSKKDANDFVIILTGEIDNITRLFTSCKSVVPEFNHLIQLDKVNSDDMLSIAKGYIKQRGFKSYEEVDGKIKNMLLAMETGNIDRLIKAMDDAIIKCENREKSDGTTNLRVLLAEDFR